MIFIPMLTFIKSHLRSVILVTVTLVIITVIGIPLVFWSYVQLFSFKAESIYLDSINSNSDITITSHSSYYSLIPKTVDQNKPAIIYYSGGLVWSDSYLYKMGLVAIELRSPVYIIKPPLNLAILRTNQARTIIENENLNTPLVGGHSLGGVAACRFVNSNTELVSGLFLYGSYCDQDISSNDIDVLSIVGGQDAIINRQNYESSLSNLPNESAIIEIEEMNHSDFANYGLQSSDNPSELSNEEVVEILANNFDYFENR